MQQFLDYVNVKHPNINFTVENEKQGTLSFLDINISRSNNKFVTSVFRKDTFTGLGLSYFSFCCNRFKINAIKTLIHRAYNISSNYLLLHQEFEFLKSYFINNGYPLFLILSVIRKFLYNNFTVHDTGNNSTTHNPVKYISLPFFGPQSEKMRSDLLKLLTKYCPTVNYKIVLSSSFKLGNFFKYKDSLPVFARSSVVYKYQCIQCDAEYVGSTHRTLHTRTCEHRGLSHRTELPLGAPPHSAVRLHCENVCGALPRTSGFKIIGHDPNFITLRILESLHILKKKPALNDTNSSFPLHIVQ